MESQTLRQQFIEKWNSKSPVERKEILTGLRWKPGEFTDGQYSENDIGEMVTLGIGTSDHALNGTTAEQLLERAVPQPPTQPEGCFSFRGRRS